MPAFTAIMKATGPLFDGSAPGIVREFERRAVQSLIEEGEQELDRRLRPRPAGVYLSVAEAGRKASKGNYAARIHGEVKSRVGRIDDSRVVYGPWLEGTGTRNQTTRFKGYHSFRLTTEHLNKNKVKFTEAAARSLVRNLNG